MGSSVADVKIASPEVVSSGETFHKFLWTVKDFSKLKENDCVTKSFPMKGRNWNLKLYPKGDSGGDGELAVYLHLADNEILARGEMVLVRVQVKALDPRGSSSHKMELTCWVMPSNRAWGMPQTMSLADLQEAILEHEDTLKVEIDCEFCNAIISPMFT